MAGPPSLATAEHQDQTRKLKDQSSSTRNFIEIHASSRAYPLWWSELDENRFLRRRYSNTESILERNICFVDTPALEPIYSPNDSSRSIDTIVQYIEQQFQQGKRLSSLSEAEVISILTGSCSSLVDLVIYIVERK